MKHDYTQEEITRRYEAWASLSAITDEQIYARRRAWNNYVDARDGRPPGTTAAQANKRETAPDPRQSELFK
jgi:hypothetical protein